MPHVITQHCCKDSACIAVCPVNCIHPIPSDGAFAGSDMLFIDPEVCIDCGACLDVCPVDAIVADYDMADVDRPFAAFAEEHFSQPGARNYKPRRAPRSPVGAKTGGTSFRVAIVGTGPAACYAARELLDRAGTDVRVDMFERLLMPWGLVRFGVAPDHLKTKEIVRDFERIADDPRVRILLGVEVGRDLTHADLAAAYDAVIYAVGATSDKRLNVPNDHLPGSHSAIAFAAWYNGHPDASDLKFDLDTARAVIIGNGNVAMDVARVLLSSHDELRRTDIAPHALDALSHSRVEEVVIVGRSGPERSAFTLPELMGMIVSNSFRMTVDPQDLKHAVTADDWRGRWKLDMLRRLSSSHTSGRRARLRFFRTAVALLGEDRVTGVQLRKTGHPAGADAIETLEAGLVFRSIGSRGAPIAGLPFDGNVGAIPHDKGRVTDPATATPVAGAYVTGWIKRGPSGVIGSNRSCAAETVDSLLADRRNGDLVRKSQVSEALAAVLGRAADIDDWRSIDRYERERGASVGRPRHKVARAEELAIAMRGRSSGHA